MNKAIAGSVNTGAGDPSDGSISTNGNVLLSLERAQIITRQPWNPPAEPPNTSPRLYGENSAWIAEHVQPFYDAPCEFEVATSPGFGWKPGVPDFKATYEKATLGYVSCHVNGKTSVPPATFREHGAWLSTYVYNYVSCRSNKKTYIKYTVYNGVYS